jgi:hypothetical protein
MNREDISFTSETVRSEAILVMRVHVDRMSKNDKDRVGHERLVAERSAEVQQCMVRRMQKYLAIDAMSSKQKIHYSSVWMGSEPG